MIKKQLTALSLIFIFIFSLRLSVSAAPTDSFTHWDLTENTKKAVYTKDVYKSDAVINARSLGLDSSIIQDIVCDKNGNIYILAGDSRILVVDESYKLIKTISVTGFDGLTVDFTDSRGIYISEENDIYIGDTNNGRVLVCDAEGKLIKEIIRPESPILPEDFAFTPTKITRDSKGYLYVISDGAYYGALLFDSNYEFLSFYGANAVEATVLSTLQNLWDMLTKNDEKRSQEMKKLPYQFLDIALDKEDFAYTCTGITADESGVGQIRMLSPGGSNILEKNFGTSVVDSGAFNFAEFDVAVRHDKDVRQNFVGIAVDDMGFIYALDSTYGLIYVYDTDCNLVTAFGGGKNSGDRIGTYSAACAIAVSEDKVFVADSLQNSVTAYEITEYGSKVLEAQSLTLDGEYIAAKPLWQEISGLDQNNRLAMSALGKAAYSEGNYKEAMTYAKMAMDRTTYDQAMKKNQEAFISENFVLIFLLIITFLAGIAVLIAVSKKRQIVLVKNQRVSIMLSCCVHPFRNFNDKKKKKMGSVILAAILSVLFFVSAVINMVYKDFRFTSFDAVTYNPVYQLVTTVGLILLWSVANWAVSVLQQGKGLFKEVFIVTSYAMLPMIVYNLLSTAVSYFINSSSDVLLSGMYVAAIILSGIILVVGTMIVHEFSLPRFLLTAILTVLAMILIVFVLFMVGMLLSQLWQFIVTVILEITYR